VELLVALAIMTLIIPVMYATLQTMYRSHASALARSLALTAGTNATEEIVRDVRGAVYGEDGSLPVAAIATSSVTLYADTDLDGAVERVRYTLVGTTLEKGVIEPTVTSSYPQGNETTSDLVTGVTNVRNGVPLFRYYAADGTELAAASDTMDVRRIVVTMDTEVRFFTATEAVESRSGAAIRNLKENY
jgi:type II secretory pathway pseudopilin PulG